MNNLSSDDYLNIIKGEVDIIHEEINLFVSSELSASLNVTNFLERVKHHLDSIERKTGTNSIDYIKISTEIVEVISRRILEYTNFQNSDKVADKLSSSETVKFFAYQRSKLEEALDTCRKLEKMNMDYAYRMRIFNKTKEKIVNRCHDKSIDTRTSTQKGIDQLKAAGSVTGDIAVETAGCAIRLALQTAVIIVIFLILMAIFGVK